MQLDIQAREFSLTEALRNHAELRLRSTLTCFNGHIQQIDMRLSDINGPRGGSDKRCQVRIVLSGQPDVVIEDTQADLYLAINRSVERAGRTVQRRLDRMRKQARQTLVKHQGINSIENIQTGGIAQ